jgi:hypothetical protein
MEEAITDYLLRHGDAIREDMLNLATSAATNPILRNYLEEAITNEIIQTICVRMNYPYESVASIITPDYLAKLFGREFFVL